MSESNYTRITVNITEKASQALDSTAKLEGVTKTDIVNRAINAYAFLIEAQNAKARIKIINDDGTQELLRFI